MNSIVSERPLHAWGERPAPARAIIGSLQARQLQPGLREEDRATLNSSVWFAELPLALRDAILGSARVREVEAGDTLARRGDVASAWIGVASGALRLGTSLRDGRDFTLDFISPGQWFGDIALMDDRPLDLDVTAHVRSRLLLVSKTDLQRLISLHDELANALLQLNCQRLRHMFRRFEEVQMLPLAQRLARQLQRLVHQFGRTRADGMCVDLALSQTDLAAIVGGSRQRVNRALRQMHLEGIVRLGEQRLMVPDEARLDDVAQGRLLLGTELSSSAV